MSLGLIANDPGAGATNAPYYMKCGWSRIETDIGGLDIFTLERR
ncbi:hypothetical protein [Starkeya nomas]|nr:hypothetical protein [Starkeya nomas]